MSDELIKQISETKINQIDLNKYSKQKLLFICGPMGSGKTTFIKNQLINHEPESNSYYYSSIDELIDNFTHLENDPRKLFQLCRKVGIIITDYLLKHKVSMILEGTGIHMDTIDYFKQLKKSGYEINTYFIKTELELCRQRVKKRNLIKENTHIVLDEDVVKYYKLLWNNTENGKMETAITEISDKIKYIMNYQK